MSDLTGADAARLAVMFLKAAGVSVERAEGGGYVAHGGELGDRRLRATTEGAAWFAAHNTLKAQPHA